MLLTRTHLITANHQGTAFYPETRRAAVPKSNLKSCALAPEGSSFRTIYELASIPQLRIGCLSVLLLFFSPWTPAQTKVQHSAAPQTEGERRGTLNLHAARSNPLQLRNLLKKMPKGADLHNHLPTTAISASGSTKSPRGPTPRMNSISS